MKLSTRNRTRSLTALFLPVLLILIISACSKSTAPDVRDQPDSFDAQLDSIKASAQGVVAGMQSNASEGQVVLPPQSNLKDGANQQNTGNFDMLSPNYKAPCLVQNYKVLNSYCSFKTFWVQQSEIVSWHIPYWLVLLLVLVLIIYVWLKLRNK